MNFGTFPFVFEGGEIMNIDLTTKLSLSALGAFAVLCFDTFAAPLIILVIVMLCDYATGLLYAYLSGTISSRVGFQGILKKVGSILAVGVAFVVDFLLSGGLFGVSTQALGFTALVVVWLILNELISILENLNKIGVPFPKFMQGLLQRLHTETEQKLSDKNKME